MTGETEVLPPGRNSFCGWDSWSMWMDGMLVVSMVLGIPGFFPFGSRHCGYFLSWFWGNDLPKGHRFIWFFDLINTRFLQPQLDLTWAAIGMWPDRENRSDSFSFLPGSLQEVWHWSIRRGATLSISEEQFVLGGGGTVQSCHVGYRMNLDTSFSARVTWFVETGSKQALSIHELLSMPVHDHDCVCCYFLMVSSTHIPGAYLVRRKRKSAQGQVSSATFAKQSTPKIVVTS